MPLSSIAETIQSGLDTSDFTDTLKFDCGDDGVIVIADKKTSLVDQKTDCTIKISTSNLEKLVAGNLNPMTGVMMGKLKVSGDPSVALKLGQLLKS
ncbi:SCP2 sterol-binding domain-containing protein [Actibacterium lipolyticum]|uniref:SCP-2 sterol transfer family protein n=1 Tax=Actibacterium lipolyticum TaxID=1524263 RepID=A0A238KW67_9RHOB|nr:SCP2 sterol-binding domain-containing protein [Actibacterium lipolyticum]SMX47045.1 SCP-2 sterol transfer family protein [Actibacterium lipolyticum]